MTMITPSYLGETIEYSSLHACRSTLEDPTASLPSTFGSGVCRVGAPASCGAPYLHTTGLARQTPPPHGWLSRKERRWPVAPPSPSRHKAFTNQERFTLRRLGAMVGSFDYHRRHCADLGQRLAVCPENLRRHQLIRDLFAARQAEEAATLDLRDGMVHLTGLGWTLGTAVAT